MRIKARYDAAMRSFIMSSWRPTVSFGCLLIFMFTLMVAGGSVRGDAWGQAIVRGTASVLIAVCVLFAPRPSLGRMRPIAWLLGAMAILVSLQLVPLPPGIWSALPGRSIVTDVGTLAGPAQVWRPMSLDPGATWNALFSLLIPGTTLFLVAGLSEEEKQLLPTVVLTLIVLAAGVALIQFSGPLLNNPLTQDDDLFVSGIFSNRNHMSLLLVLGCILSPIWIFTSRKPTYLRGLISFGLVVLFLLIILGIGSRTSLLLCLPALVAGLWTVYKPLQRAFGRGRPWLVPAILVAGLSSIMLVIITAALAGRAMSLDRFIALDASQDMRARGLPVVMTMIREYFPFGSGLGSFDPVFRMHEPLSLLKPTYFNHAHNDFLEIVLDAGLLGFILLAIAVAWWGWQSVQVWRLGGSTDNLRAKAASLMFLFILAASAFDYPARTPMMMMLLVIVGTWLCERNAKTRSSAL